VRERITGAWRKDASCACAMVRNSRWRLQVSHGFARRPLSHSEPARCLTRCSFGEACVGFLRCKDELGVRWTNWAGMGGGVCPALMGPKQSYQPTTKNSARLWVIPMSYKRAAFQRPSRVHRRTYRACSICHIHTPATAPYLEELCILCVG